MAIAVILIGLVFFFRDEAIIKYLEREKKNEKRLYSEHKYTYIEAKEKGEIFGVNKGKAGIRKPKLRRIY